MARRLGDFCPWAILTSQSKDESWSGARGNLDAMLPGLACHPRKHAGEMTTLLGW